MTNVPRNFPAPYIRDCVVDEVLIEIKRGRFESKCSLESASGAVYEIVKSNHRESIFGEVMHGIKLELQYANIYRRTNLEVAIKRYIKANMLRGENIEDPMKEFSAMQYIENPGCPHVITSLEIVEDLEYYYSIMPFINGGELFENIKNEGKLSEDEAYRYFKQILTGLGYLQQKYICHRDLSLENILITKTGEIKIIDFGMCLLLPFEIVNYNVIEILPQGIAGKLYYMAPEIFRNTQPFNGLKSDIWSLGIILFILLCGIPPFQFPSVTDKGYRLFASTDIIRLINNWNIQLSIEALDLLNQILQINPNKRLVLAQIENHPWMKRN